MAYGKKRTRRGRVLTRRKSFGKLKQRRTVRRLKRRSGVYVKRTRFPAKNPFGDKAFVKLRFNYAGYFQGDNASTQNASPFPLNDLNAVYAVGAQSLSKDFITYPKLFRRYKVNGIMAKLTLFQLQPTTGDPYPLIGWMIPYSVLDGTPTVIAQNANAIKGERHTAWTNIKNWGWGGSSTTLKKFFKMKTLVGANYPSTDIDYSGVTDITGNPYQAPPIIWGFYAGVSTVAQIALPSAVSVHYNLEITYYVEYFEQTPWDMQSA